MAQCAICGKKTSFGNKLSITRSHVSKRTVKAVRPNLRTVKAVVDGENKKTDTLNETAKNHDIVIDLGKQKTTSNKKK